MGGDPKPFNFHLAADANPMRNRVLPQHMSKKMAIVLIVFGAALVGLGFAMRQVGPRHGNTTSLAGLAGGELCLL